MRAQQGQREENKQQHIKVRAHGKMHGMSKRRRRNETSEMARWRGKTQLEIGRWREAGDREVNGYEMAWSASQLGDRVEREQDAANDCERQRKKDGEV